MQHVNVVHPTYTYIQTLKSLDECVIIAQRENGKIVRIQFDYDTAVKLATEIIEHSKRYDRDLSKLA